MGGDDVKESAGLMTQGLALAAPAAAPPTRPSSSAEHGDVGKKCDAPRSLQSRRQGEQATAREFS